MATLLDNIFSGEAGVACRLLSLFGIDGVFTLKSSKTYDPSDGSEISITGNDYDVTVTPQLQYNTRDVDGINILRSDLYCFISPLDLINDISVLTPGDLNQSTIEINSICYNIIAIQSIFSGEENVAYKFQLRENNQE